MKNTKKGFWVILIIIFTTLALIVGGKYYLNDKNKEAKLENETYVADVQEPEKTISDEEIKTYNNSQFGVRFDYPIDKVSISNNNVFSKNGGNFVNFEIKSGGNFAFDILEDSDKMTPSFNTELDEVKFKSSISQEWNEITKFSEVKIGGRTAYKMQVYAKGNNDIKECYYEKIVTKNNGYWYEFYAKICDLNADESLKVFESVVSSLEFKN